MADIVLPADDGLIATFEFGFSLPTELSWTEGGFYDQGTYGGVTAVYVQGGTLTDEMPVMVARTPRAARIKAYPESSNVSPGEADCTTFEGTLVRVQGRLYWADGSLVHRDDVSMVERYLFDITGRQPIHLATDRIDPRRCLYTSLQKDQSWDVDTYGFQFENEVDGAWFEGGRGYMIEWVVERNSGTRERLPLVCRVRTKPLLHKRSVTFGRRSSS